MINTTPLHSAALRRLYSAKSRYRPDYPTQALFGLQDLRDFAISQPLGTDKKRYVPAQGASSRDRDEILSKLPNPMFMQYAIIFCCIALALTIHELGHLSCRATVQHEDKEPQYLCRPWFSSVQHPRQVVSPPDGGQIVFAAYKCIVRRLPNERFKIIVTLVGITVLIASTPYLVIDEII